MAQAEEVETVRVEPDDDRLERLNLLLAEVWGGNPFYRDKWRRTGLHEESLASPGDLGRFPFTSRAELERDQRRTPLLGTNLTFPLEEYHQVHRSSGTSGASLLWADTRASWEWLVGRSEALFRMAGVDASDRVLLAAGGGAAARPLPGRALSPPSLPILTSAIEEPCPPHLVAPLGPRVVHDGALRVGCTCLPPVAVPPEEATVLAGKPERMLRLARRLKVGGIRPASLGVRKLILSGDPGGCRGLLRRRLAEVWEAEVFERYGLTEAGSVAGECPSHPGGMHVLEDAFIAEVINPETREVLPDGGRGELVLTTLGRSASPIVRYRTGDLVTLVRGQPCGCGRSGGLLAGEIRRRGDPRPGEKAASPGIFSRPDPDGAAGGSQIPGGSCDEEPLS